MKLKVGGIYTDIDDCISIIIDKSENLYFVCIIDCQIENVKRNRKSVVTYIINHYNSLTICHCKKTTSFMTVDIDGYLGQIDDEILKQLKKILVSKSWYTDWK